MSFICAIYSVDTLKPYLFSMCSLISLYVAAPDLLLSFSTSKSIPIYPSILSLRKRTTVSTCVQIQIISPQNYGYLDNIFTVLIPFVQSFSTRSWMVLILHHTNCATACGTITFFHYFSIFIFFHLFRF